MSDAVLPADRDHRNDHPVSGDMAAIAEHFVADFTNPRDVDEHTARGRLVGDAGALRVELDDVTVLGEQHLQPRLEPRITRCAMRACCDS